MRVLYLGCLLFLLLADGSVVSVASGAGLESLKPSLRTTRVQARPPGDRSPEEIRKRGAEYLTQCLKDWEPATHMTKNDWERTCRRVAQDRLKFLLEQAKDDPKR